MAKKPIGAYETENGGHVAYDKAGLTWPVDTDLAEELEAGRAERNKKAGKRPS